MQKLKLAAILLLSTTTGLTWPLGGLSTTIRLQAQDTATAAGLPQGMHSILESELEESDSLDVDREEGREIERESESERENDAERRATLKSAIEEDAGNETTAELRQPSGFEESLPAPKPEPQASDSRFDDLLPSNTQSSNLQSSGPARLDWPMLPTKLGYDVLLASPVHEALVSVDEVAQARAPMSPVSLAPPEPIQERPATPAAEPPRGAELTSATGWIGGYWTWLPDLGNYVWVSGVQRIAPPGRVWISGSWNRSGEGFQWVPGFWDVADKAGALARESLPAPPAARAEGPIDAPPNADSFWVPGHWAAREDWKKLAADARGVDAYQWREGFWTQHVEPWIWQPARVVATRDGYRDISGYWDYEPQDRGQGFAAVVFHPKTLEDSSYTFEPFYPLSRTPALLLHLFVQAEQAQLYYGDLYGDPQVALGYRPWYLPNDRPQVEPPRLAGSDTLLPPLLDYYLWKYHSVGIDFIGSMARYAQHFRSSPSVRPAAQTDKRPELAIREGLAGRVNASSFEQIVLGNVDGRGALLLDGSIAPADIASPERHAGNIGAVTQASATQASATARAKIPLQSRSLTPSSSAASASAGGGSFADGVQRLPRGAAPFGQRGSAAMLVLPGGRVVLAPPGLVPPGLIPPSLRGEPNSALLAPPALRLPPSPGNGPRGRMGRR